MKSLVILGFLIVANLSVAAPMFCSGNGYQLAVNDQKTEATLTLNQQTLQFGDMHCAVQTENETVMYCASKNVADAGYSIFIALALPGQTTGGNLSEESFAGARVIAELTCVQAAN